MCSGNLMLRLFVKVYIKYFDEKKLDFLYYLFNCLYWFGSKKKLFIVFVLVKELIVVLEFLNFFYL